MAVLRRLWLTDFRNYDQLDIAFERGRVVLSGANGQGKSNVLEAIAYLGTLGSFRGAPPEALIRADADQAVVRAEVQAVLAEGGFERTRESADLIDVYLERLQSSSGSGSRGSR